MGRVRLAAGLTALAGLSLTACFTPGRTAGPERAIAIYREARGRGAPRRAAGAAGASEAAPRALGVEEAVAMARERSARLGALEARAAMGAAEVEAADRYENPELRVSQLRLDQVADGAPEVRTAIRVTPSRPGEVDAEVAEARAVEAEARAEARAEALSLEADVRWLFDDILLLDAEIAAADAVASARQRLATKMRAGLAAAEVTAIDEAMAELAAAEAAQDSAEQRGRLQEARSALLDLTGLDPGAQVRLVGEPAAAWPPPELPPEEALIEAALRSRPEIKLAAARIDAADARGHIERAKRWPWLSFVELGYDFAPGIEGALGWTFQAGVELPIFDTNRGGVRVADAARAEAKRALSAEVELVVREVRGRLREARAAAALVTELQRRAVPAAERAAAAARRALEGREVDAIRALTIDERRVGVELRLLDLRRRYRTAIAELRRAVGGPLPVAPSGDRRAPPP